MSTHLCDFTTLNESQKEMILTWRNHENVKTFMYNAQIISQEEHLRFIESLKTSHDKRYFLVYHEEEAIGVIDFTHITPQRATIGLYANPTLSRKGLGKELMCAIISYGFETLHVKKLRAELFAFNTKAKALYEAFGFYETIRKTLNKHEIICMELAYENRPL
ncbi:MAG: UDP-4-amino-4,6-dideoxy-N-acetyl-beta-L-altrosamine N-acetyltransferase [Epsilonproteobacteria bacterium]|nr:UDP-4-amino-4,6-dideoxy-N-acetyl-beta-L-altrosamine N-acetyltransferase [Campylobacterota bacterium]